MLWALVGGVQLGRKTGDVAQLWYAVRRPTYCINVTARPAYFALLISHVVLAVANVPLVIVTLWRAKHGDWERHKRMARITFPVWIYVSLTGILVYFVLYHWNPPAAR